MLRVLAGSGAVLALILSGCAGPSYVSCKGKGTVSGSVSAMLYNANYVITADCGEHFEYEERTYRPRPPKAKE